MAMHRHNHIRIDLTTADCLYADTTEPISIQFFVLEGREVIEKSEKFHLTNKGDLMERAKTRTFHIHKSSGYCREKKLCSELSFVGLFVGDRESKEMEFDTWNANNISVAFHFDHQKHEYNFDFSTDGECVRPLHFWSPEFWHRYGPEQEFEERSDEYALGDKVFNPTYIFF
ncbi:unnamed protein product, partial [Mesorhabditis spiculigera]